MKKLLVILCISFISLSVNAQGKLVCKGTTKAGIACKSTIVSKQTGFCNAHNPNRAHCKAQNSKGQPCGVAPIKETEYCRHHHG
jgi:hypothetical protein